MADANREAVIRRRLQVAARWANGLATMIAVGVLIVRLVETVVLGKPTGDLPSLASCLSLLVTTGSLARLQREPPRTRRIGRIGAAAIALLPVLTLVEEATGVALGTDLRFLGFAEQAGHMSIVSAILFLLVACAVFLLGEAAPRRPRALPFLALAIAALASVTVAGYAFRAIVAYPLPLPLGTPLLLGVAFLLIAFSLAAGRPGTRLPRLLASERPGDVLVRRLLPAAIGVPIVLAWLELLGERYGLFDQAVGAGFLTLMTVGVLSALIIWVARALDEMDARRGRAEGEARRHREWLQVTLASIGDGVVATDQTGRVRFMNPAAQRLTGWGERDAIGCELKDIVVVLEEGTQGAREFPLEGALRELRAVAASEGTILRSRDGGEHPVEVSAAPILDPEQGVLGGVLVLRDATVRRQAERAMRAAYAELDRRVIERTADLERTSAALRERTALLDAISSSTPDLVYAKDREGRFLMANPALLKLIGKREDELVGQTLSDVLADVREAARIGESERPVFESGEVAVSEHSFAAPEGPRTYLITSSALRDADDRTVGLIGVGMDITDRKRAEHELEALFAAEQRLREEAERASRVKDEFLSIVSHELRSPLNALRGWGHLLASTRPPDQGLLDRATRAIKRNVEQQARLIDDLLDMTRLMSGRLAIERQPLDLVELTHVALEELRPMAAAKSIELRFTADHPAVTAEGDMARLQQVVRNLVSNAIKFTPEHGAIATSLQAGGDWIELAVTDTGIGIPAEYFPHLFERFSQADQSTTRRAGGLGVGLALVRHIVELHGGRVSVESQGPGRGTTFTVELPRARIGAAPATEPAPPPAPRPVAASLAGTRVLMVDDEADARDVIALALRQAGANVQAVASGRELGALLEDAGEWPDVLLLDLAMPEEDGFAVLARVRALETRRGIEPAQRLPAIAVTAFSQMDRARLEAAGFRSLVAKPVEAAKLLAAIQSALTDVPSAGGSPKVAASREARQT
jgi:PAS domain S-box-containing protein